MKKEYFQPHTHIENMHIETLMEVMSKFNENDDETIDDSEEILIKRKDFDKDYFKDGLW